VHLLLVRRTLGSDYDVPEPGADGAATRAARLTTGIVLASTSRTIRLNAGGRCKPRERK
jgi:hypothetical protein